MLGALEKQLIYFPTRVAGDAPTPVIPGADRMDEVWLEASDGVRIHGLHAVRESPLAYLLHFHGNAGNLYDRLDNVAGLVDAGFDVLIIDYRGYGKSEGSPSEAGLYRDGAAALAYLTGELEVDPSRIVLFGRSLGSTVAIELATREPAAAALIAESAFTSAKDMARLHYGWLPSMVLKAMNHDFDSLSKVSKLKAPVLWVHGAIDQIVPSEMGRRLYEASPEPKDWYEIPGAGHNDTPFMGGAEYYERLVEFVRRHVR